MYVYAYLVAIASVLKYGVRNEPKHVLVELSVSKSQEFSCCFVIVVIDCFCCYSNCSFITVFITFVTLNKVPLFSHTLTHMILLCR